MPGDVTDLAIKSFLVGIRERLDRAAGLARAAEACGHDGHLDQALQLAMEMEPPLYEARTFLEAANLLVRGTDQLPRSDQ
jgi:hypothetical protein